MRPTRTIVTLLFAAAVAVTGCSAHPTTRQAGAPASPPAPSPAAPPAAPAPPVPPAPLTPSPRVGTWQRLPAAPIPGGSYAGVWTGTELLVEARVADFSGSVPKRRIVGAAYNPATRSWRMLPPGPVPTQALGDDNAVWTGHELLTWGMGLGAAYNPAANRWRTIATGSLGSPAVTVWTGRQMLVWGGGCCEEYVAGGEAYNPASDTWQSLPPSPLQGRHSAAGAWTGRELIVAGGNSHEYHPNNRSNTDSYPVLADAAAYNPTTRTWRHLPPMPAPRRSASATWDGTEVLVVGGQGTNGPLADGVAYDPATNRWRRLPAMPLARAGHTAVWTGRQLLVWGGQTVRGSAEVTPPHGVAYDPASNRWSALPVSPLHGRTGHVAVWTGTALLVWGGFWPNPGGRDRMFADGAAYMPAAL